MGAGMSKGERTRELILAKSARLFNRRGYFGASMSDIMRETGLEKGGIYNHFGSKDDLALASFDYSIARVEKRYSDEIKKVSDAGDRLLAIVNVFSYHIEDPIVEGGCPILNTAVESDDTHPALRERSRAALERWTESIRSITHKGIERGQVRPDVDADELATMMISMLEGAVMMSKLYGDDIHMRRVVKHLTKHIENNVVI
jgi:AcrR family transcriptional regulator